jgi:hypothetical protein
MQKGKHYNNKQEEKGKTNDSTKRRPREDNNPYILYIWITNIDRG